MSSFLEYFERHGGEGVYLARPHADCWESTGGLSLILLDSTTMAFVGLRRVSNKQATSPGEFRGGVSGGKRISKGVWGSVIDFDWISDRLDPT